MIKVAVKRGEEQLMSWPHGINSCASFDLDPILLAHVRTQVLMEALPPTWTGKLMFVDHMAGFVSSNTIILGAHTVEASCRW